MNITGKTVIIRYGIGCELSDNCFVCTEENDCNCKAKHLNRASIMTDERIIYGEDVEVKVIRNIKGELLKIGKNKI